MSNCHGESITWHSGPEPEDYFAKQVGRTKPNFLARFENKGMILKLYSFAYVTHCQQKWKKKR